MNTTALTLWQCCRATLGLSLALVISACGTPPYNNPYGAEESTANVIFSSFPERPKHLDPARAYSANEFDIISQIYEPLLQYHFLLRPYQLMPLAAEALPQVTYYDAAGHVLPADAPASAIAVSQYDLVLRPGMRFQPHPAFARNAHGEWLYHRLPASTFRTVRDLSFFRETGTRELTAEDYVFQIKRLVAPHLHSPIAELMSGYIIGLKELGQQLTALASQQGHAVTAAQLRDGQLAGATAVDAHHLRIRLKGKYEQFQYWLAMPFFAPVPWEVEAFYGQPGMADKNISLDWYPVGSGAYYLKENNPNRRMVLQRNPYFHGEIYPTAGEPEDAEVGWLRDAGQSLPFVDRIVLTLEKEEIPRWNKFLQGYYDTSGIGSDSFDQAIAMSTQGATLSDTLRQQGIQLITGVSPSIFYLGFNMLDPVVGGYDVAHRKLRQALSIAMDEREFIAIFLNERGVPAQGVLPPGIFGYLEGPTGINPYVYDWAAGQPQRKSLAVARRLLAEAGYPNGRDSTQNKPLVLYFDVAAQGPDDKATLDWYRKQLDKLGVQLVVRATDYNQFQQKMLSGNAQIFAWGWNADYPDPENFFFLLYGGNSKVKHGGENAANYANPEFDRLFEQMRDMTNGPERQQVIDRMQEIARRDAPWVFKFYPKRYTLAHQWYGNAKRNEMANNTLKYRQIDGQLRANLQRQWNQTHWWPLGVAALLFAVPISGVALFRRRSRGASR